MSIGEWIQLTSVVIASIAAVASWKTAIASKEATDISLTMYREQKEEFEKSFLPVFEVRKNLLSSDTAQLKLINRNKNPISITNIAYEGPIEQFEDRRPSEEEIKLQFLGTFTEHDQIRLWLYYNTLNHKYYSSEIVFRLVDNSVVIENHYINERN